MQATIAIEREQQNHATSKDAPAANPLNFDVAIPDISKVRLLLNRMPGPTAQQF